MHPNWAIALIIGALAFCNPAAANFSSYHLANPVGWMHDLPVGEQPGWSQSNWFNLEINQANVWSPKFDLKDRRTGAVYTYQNDFEQSTAVAEIGTALSDSWAFSLEIPYANRNGGFLDDFIDQFHTFIDSDRFFRQFNNDYDNKYIVQTNGADRLATDKAEGVGSLKAKLKWWMLKWSSPTPGICDCGFAISGQWKFPVMPNRYGLSSGSQDGSLLLHLGIPLFRYSSLWATSAFTKLGPNEVFADWPRRDWQQMYELSLDLGISEGWGIMMQARYESPIFMKEYLDYQYTSSTEEARHAERIASAWNALTAWRGSQSIGARYRWGKGSQINLLFVEDFALPNDENGHFLSINDAPDVEFLTQWHFVF